MCIRDRHHREQQAYAHGQNHAQIQRADGGVHGLSLIHIWVDLRIRPGEYVAFVGASGSGKSTRMHILGCRDTPTGGSDVRDGEDVSRMDARALCRVRREKIGFVFQGYQLLSKLTAADNVAFPLMPVSYTHLDVYKRQVFFYLRHNIQKPRRRHHRDTSRNVRFHDSCQGQ